MVGFAWSRIASALLIVVAVAGAPLSAQEIERPTPSNAAAVAPAPTLPPRLTPDNGRSRERRPGALVPLYVSFSTLQVLDTHSTWRALDRGGVEANPIMRGIVRNRIGLLGLKAAGTAGIIYATEQMWKRNKPASIIFMIAANSAMGWVVQNNYRAVR